MTDEQFRKAIRDAVAGGAAEVDLSWKEMRYLPAAIGELTGVRRLSLRANWLRDLPHEIAELRNLVALDVADNVFESALPPSHRVLPLALLKMTWLEELDIGWTYVESLPDEFGNLARLRKLTLETTDLNIVR